MSCSSGSYFRKKGHVQPQLDYFWWNRKDAYDKIEHLYIAHIEICFLYIIHAIYSIYMVKAKQKTDNNFIHNTKERTNICLAFKIPMTNCNEHSFQSLLEWHTYDGLKLSIQQLHRRYYQHWKFSIRTTKEPFYYPSSCSVHKFKFLFISEHILKVVLSIDSMQATATLNVICLRLLFRKFK